MRVARLTNRSADIHARGRFLGLGPLVAHSDPTGRIREKDGTFYRGSELGFVDRKHRIRRKRGLFKKSDVIGHIRGNSAYHCWPVHGESQRCGYIDQYGNVWQQGSDERPSRIIGKATGADPEVALAYFVLRFQDLVDHVGTLEDKINHSSDKHTFLPRVRAIARELPEIDALGNIDAVTGRLRALESQCLAQVVGPRSSTRHRLRHQREQLETALRKARVTIAAAVDDYLPAGSVGTAWHQRLAQLKGLKWRR